MSLTKKQKEAVKEAPLFLGQSESNLNYMFWTNSKCNKWFQCRTVRRLVELGKLQYATIGKYGDEDETCVINNDPDVAQVMANSFDKMIKSWEN